MKPTTSLLACALLAVLPSFSQAALLSYWSFNNVNPAYGSLLGSLSTSSAAYGEAYTQTNTSTPGTLASNTGNSTVFNGAGIKIDFSNIATITGPTINGKKWSDHINQEGTGGPAGYGTFTGSTTNAVGSVAAGDSLLLLNTSGNIRTKYITFSLSSAGYDTLSLSYATRLTNSVASSQEWTYSTDGTNFFSLATKTPTANGTFTAQTLDLSTLSSSALNNQSAFYLRMTYQSANTQGSQALDNIQLTGTPVPEPTVIAPLIGAVALLFRRKRR